MGKPKGFAGMAPEKVRELARKGGKAAQAGGTAHRFTSEEAKRAGRLGGKETHRRRRAELDTEPAPAPGPDEAGE